MAGWAQWIRGGLDALQSKHLLRTLRPIVPIGGAHSSPVKVMLSASTLESWLGDANGAEAAAHRRAAVLACDRAPRGEALHGVTLFSTNDYLGLSSHPRVRRAMSKACEDWGGGPRSSALVAGHTAEQRDLASALAKLKSKEACVLFPSGFAANVAAAACLAASPDVEVFSDELNHASIIDGLRMAMRGDGAKKRLSVYRHCDMAHLESLLSASTAPRRLVITDSLFSMDGDVAPLAALAALRRRYGFLLLVDDAHASLVFGSTGGGVAEAAGVEGEVDVVVGTLSKAETRNPKPAIMNHEP
ncbi:pyridoxal phosphate-dependent transferase [Baffinella frigidus]|nr:pyridoxal phosphate-dependent transferase [Cryptophyta sp. CCMP2293]